MKPEEITQLIDDKDIRFIDLRFTDMLGKEQHISLPVSIYDEEALFEHGHPFDGSSMSGWKGVQASS